MEDARSLLCQTPKSLKGRLSLVCLLFWEDKITVVGPFGNERSVNFEIGLNQRARIIRYLKVIDLARFLIHVMHDEGIVDDLHSYQGLRRESDLALETIDQRWVELVDKYATKEGIRMEHNDFVA